MNMGIQYRRPILPKPIKNDFQQLPSQATPLPYSVPSLSELPDSLRLLTLQSVEITNEPISICVFPGRTRLKNWYSWEHVAEQALVFTTNGILHVQAQASPHQVASMVYLRATDLLYARLSLQLMYGRLEFVYDCVSRIEVEFNSAGFDLLRPGLQSLLGANSAGNSIVTPETPQTRSVLSDLGTLSFKFKNGLYLYGLLPEEHLLGFVFQPGIWERHWPLFPLRVLDTTLLALTDRQLIVVEEQSGSRFPAYGWIFTFFPRRVIEKIRVTPSSRWQELIVELNTKVGLIDRRILLKEENALVWQELWLQFGNLCAHG
jgi:hypothetical protein